MQKEDDCYPANGPQPQHGDEKWSNECPFVLSISIDHSSMNQSKDEEMSPRSRMIFFALRLVEEISHLHSLNTCLYIYHDLERSLFSSDPSVFVDLLHHLYLSWVFYGIGSQACSHRLVGESQVDPNEMFSSSTSIGLHKKSGKLVFLGLDNAGKVRESFRSMSSLIFSHWIRRLSCICSKMIDWPNTFQRYIQVNTDTWHRCGSLRTVSLIV